MEPFVTSLPQSEKSPLSSWHRNATFLSSENVKLALLLSLGFVGCESIFGGSGTAAVAPAVSRTPTTSAASRAAYGRTRLMT